MQRCQNEFDVVRQETLVLLCLASPTGSNYDINSVEAETYQEGNTGYKLTIAQIQDEAIREFINSRHVIRRAICCLKSIVLVKANDNGANTDSDDCTEVPKESQPLRSDLNRVMRTFFQMLHFIDELWSSRNEIVNLMLITFSVDRPQKQTLSGARQESSDWLNREVNSHDLIVFDNLDVSSVLRKEHVYVLECSRSISAQILSFFEHLSHIW